MTVLFVVLVLAFLVSTAHAGEEPMAARTRAAIGLAPLERGLSLWLVRPKTMAGLELDRFEWSKDRVFEWSEPYPGREHIESFHFRVSLAVQRTFTKGPMFQFGYLRINHISYQAQAEASTNGGGTGFEGGWGILWRPWEKLAVSLRQGVVYEGYEEFRVDAPYLPGGFVVWDVDYYRLRMQKPRLWVLIHF